MDARAIEQLSGTRRRLLVGAAASVASMAAASADLASSETASARGSKGPSVWLDMDQAELDTAYDQGAYAPNLPQVTKRWAINSDAVRTRLGVPERHAYGPGAVEGLDWYRTRRPNAPVNIFIHGGEWRLGQAKGWAFPAELFVAAGAHFVMPDFSSSQDVRGNLATLADQVRRAVAWVHANAARLNADPQRLYISGHSSGSHLAAVALTTDWQKDFGLPANVLKGALLSSGVFDLAPVCLSARRRTMTCSSESTEALSPQRHLDRLNAPLIVSHGSLESPEYQRHARDFAAAVRAAGKPVQLLIGEGYNHFEVIETLGNPYGLLGRAVLEQMRLTAAR